MKAIVMKKEGEWEFITEAGMMLSGSMVKEPWSPWILCWHTTSTDYLKIYFGHSRNYSTTKNTKISP